MLRQKLKYNFEQGIRLLGQIIVGTKLFNFPILMEIRDLTYRILFGFGKGFHCGHNCFIDREHRKFDGSIQVGEHVFFSHDTNIDYTGHLIVKDNVKITEGVSILTHARDIDALRKKGLDINNQVELIIEENAYIGAKSIILASCHYIGKNAIVGAGSIVTKDVLDNVLVAGVPAKIIKTLE
ncbi:MAG: acyltransferase [Paludibacteraceae bacterium]|nr:acyltransferase [Paludibacteraceae bacterium]